MRKAILFLTLLGAAFAMVACQEQAPVVSGGTSNGTGETKTFDDPKQDTRGGQGPTSTADQ